MSSFKDNGFLPDPLATSTSTALPKENVLSPEEVTIVSVSNHSQDAVKRPSLPLDLYSSSYTMMSVTADTMPETVMKQGDMDAEPQMLFSVNQDKSAKLICSFSQPTVAVKEEDDSNFGDSLTTDENSQTQAKEADHPIPSSSNAEKEISHHSHTEQETAVKEEEISTEYPEPEIPAPVFSFLCKYCGQKLKHQQSLWKHEEGHRNGTIYKCRFCNYHTLSRPFMEGHESQHTGIKPFKCDHCEHRTRYSIDMQKHQRVHSNTRKFKCHLCPFKSKWKGGMDKHLLTHTNIRNFSCPLCSARFKRKSGLKTHMTIHSSDKPFKCDKCSYSCRIMSMLRMHSKSHSDVRNFACSYPGCTQKCKTRSDLTKHYNVHLETCDFECPKCGKKFKSRHSLNCHIHRHDEKEMDFICNFCDKKLSTRFGLRKHLTQHFSEKKHCCSICGHKFFNRSNMLKHMTVHDGSEKDFCCPICKFFGKDVSILLTHIGQMHGKDYTYFCEECRKPFSTVLRMKQHVRRCHEDKIQAGCDEFVYNQHCCDAFSSLEYKQNPLEGVAGYETGLSSNLGPVNPALDSDPNLGSNSQIVPSDCNELINMSRDKEDNILAGKSVNKCNSPGNQLTFDKVPSASKDGTCDSFGNGGQKEETSADSSASMPAASIVKSLVIKLERLTEVRMGEDLSVDGSLHATPAPPKVVKIGSIGNVGISLASRDSGVQFNFEKRGKKTKRWFMDMGHKPSNDVNRKKRQWKRQRLSNTSNSKERKSSTPKRSDGKGKRKASLASDKEVQKSNAKRSKMSSLAKRSPLKKKTSARNPAVSTGDMQREEMDPPPVNFDVIVRCERLTTAQVKKAMRGCKTSFKPPSVKSRNYGALMSSSGNKDLTIRCEQLDPNEIDFGVAKNHKALESDSCLPGIVHGASAVSHEQLANLHHSPNPGTSTKRKLSPPKSRRRQSMTKNKAEVSPSTVIQKPRNRLNKKAPKRSAKGVEKAKVDVGFVEESSFVEDILDSPFQITWKTMRKVEENASSRKESHQRKHLPESADNSSINSIFEIDVDQKPNWLTNESNLDISLNLLKNSGRSHCSVQVEDIGYALHTHDTDKNISSLIDHKRRNEAQAPIHTLTLDEFEEEYKQKKKLIAKVNIVPQPLSYLEKQQISYRQGFDKGHNDEALHEETNKNSTLKETVRKSCSSVQELEDNIEVDVPEETSLEKQKNPCKPSNTSKLSKGQDENMGKRNSCDSQCKNTKTFKVKEIKPKKKRKRKVTIALFRSNFLERQKKSTSGTANKKSHKGKEIVFPRTNLNFKNSFSSGNVEIVELWKMAFECMTNQVSVGLYDFKNLKPIPLSHVKKACDNTSPSTKEIPHGHAACAKKLVEQFSERSLVIHESDECRNAIASCEIQSSSMGIDMAKRTPSACTVSAASFQSLQGVDVDDNQPKKSPCANDIRDVNRKSHDIPMPSSEHPLVGDASSISFECDSQNGQSPVCSETKQTDVSQGSAIVGNGHEDKSHQELSLVCSHKSALIHHDKESQQELEVSPVQSKNEGRHDILTFQSITDKQRDVTVNSDVELGSKFADAIKFDSEDKLPSDMPASPADSDHQTMGIYNAGTKQSVKSLILQKRVSETSQVDVPNSSLDTPTPVRKSGLKQSIADFLRGREKSLQKLFASHQVKVTPQGLGKYMNEWKHLPLPGNFSMNENGLISELKKDSVEPIENGSSSTFSGCFDNERGNINAVSPHEEEKVESKGPDEFDSEKIIKRERKRNVSFGQGKGREGKKQKIISTKQSPKPHSSNMVNENETQGQTYIKSWTVLAEVHKHIDHDPLNGLVGEKSDNPVTSDDCDTGGQEISHHHKEAAELRSQYKTSNPMLCLSNDDMSDVLDHQSTSRVSDSDQSPSCLSELPLKVGLHEPSHSLSEVFFDNDSEFPCGLQGATSQPSNLLIESEVLPPSDDICPLPEDFFNDSL